MRPIVLHSRRRGPTCTRVEVAGHTAIWAEGDNEAEAVGLLIQRNPILGIQIIKESAMPSRLPAAVAVKETE